MKKLLIFVLALVSSGWAQTSATGALTVAAATCTGNGSTCSNLVLNDPYTGAVGIDISGTFVGTGQLEASIDGKALDDATKTWRAISVTPVASTTTVTSFTAGGAWRVAVSGVTDIRVRCSAYTSGTIVVAMRSSRQAASLGGGGTSLPALSDNGTNVISTEVIMVPESTSVAGVRGASNATGWAISGTSQWGIASASRRYAFDGGGQQLNMSSAWLIGFSSNADPGIAVADAAWGRVAAASIRQGLANSATPVAQTYTLGESSRGGTDSDVAGASGTIKPGIGTGLGAGTKFCIQRNLMGATGSVAQSTIDGYCVGPSKKLSNTSATAQSLVNISVPSNSAGGVEGTITITCTDGTNFDAETQSFNTSFVNKATVLTVTSPVITGTSAANNSGSCTAGITAVAGTNSVDIKVTPVFTTIVPTTVTSYIALRNNGTGNATFN